MDNPDEAIDSLVNRCAKLQIDLAEMTNLHDRAIEDLERIRKQYETLQKAIRYTEGKTPEDIQVSYLLQIEENHRHIERNEKLRAKLYHIGLLVNEAKYI